METYLCETDHGLVTRYLKYKNITTADLTLKAKLVMITVLHLCLELFYKQ